MSSENILGFSKLIFEANWTPLMETDDTQSAFDTFYKIINSSADISFPYKEVKNRKIGKLAKWMTPCLIISSRKKIGYG